MTQNECDVEGRASQGLTSVSVWSGSMIHWVLSGVCSFGSSLLLMYLDT